MKKIHKYKNLILWTTVPVIIGAILVIAFYFGWLPIDKYFTKEIANPPAVTSEMEESIKPEIKKEQKKEKKSQAKPKIITIEQQVAKTPAARSAQNLAWLKAMESCHGVHGIHTKNKVVAITFDDGPNGKYTEEILETLNKHHAKATFFLVGSNVLRYPTIVKNEFNANHVIANHSFSHPHFSQLASGAASEELTKTNAVLFNLFGVIPHLFRPPYGVCSELTTTETNQLGFKTIIWTDITNDYDVKQTTAETIAKDILKIAHPGGIIALHDGGGDRSKSAAALEIILSTLEKDGYEFVTVPELINTDPYQIQVKDLTATNRNYSKTRYINTIVLKSTRAPTPDENNPAENNFAEKEKTEIINHHLAEKNLPHYLIERDGDIDRLVPDNIVTHHANNAETSEELKNINDYSIGIEVINDEQSGPTQAQYAALRKLIKTLKQLYKINHVLDFKGNFDPLKIAD